MAGVAKISGHLLLPLFLYPSVKAALNIYNHTSTNPNADYQEAIAGTIGLASILCPSLAVVGLFYNTVCLFNNYRNHQVSGTACLLELGMMVMLMGVAVKKVQGSRKERLPQFLPEDPNEKKPGRDPDPFKHLIGICMSKSIALRDLTPELYKKYHKELGLPFLNVLAKRATGSAENITGLFKKFRGEL